MGGVKGYSSAVGGAQTSISRQMPQFYRHLVNEIMLSSISVFPQLTVVTSHKCQASSAHKTLKDTIEGYQYEYSLRVVT